MSSKRRARPLYDGSTPALTPVPHQTASIDDWHAVADSKRRVEPSATHPKRKRPAKSGSQLVIARQDYKLNRLYKELRELQSELTDVSARLRFIELAPKLKAGQR